MVALDGIPFLTFCTSLDLRAAIKARNLPEELPKTSTTVRKLVIDFANHVCQEQKIEITKLKETSHKFSATFDEWTSGGNRRFLNIIVHGIDSKFWNLGLTRIRGSMTAEKCVEIVSNSLSEFNLSLEDDLVSTITDGASVMVKFGRISATLHQLCFAHGVQLAITDVLYPSAKTDSPTPNSDDDESSDLDTDEDERELNEGFRIEDEVENEISHETMKPLVNKVRKVVKMFKRSPLKNEALQKYVQADFRIELKLILDTKTRWNSLLDMIQRFYLLRNCILKALIDLKEKITLEEWEFDVLRD